MKSGCPKPKLEGAYCNMQWAGISNDLTRGKDIQMSELVMAKSREVTLNPCDLVQ